MYLYELTLISFLSHWCLARMAAKRELAALACRRRLRRGSRGGRGLRPSPLSFESKWSAGGTSIIGSFLGNPLSRQLGRRHDPLKLGPSTKTLRHSQSAPSAPGPSVPVTTLSTPPRQARSAQVRCSSASQTPLSQWQAVLRNTERPRMPALGRPGSPTSSLDGFSPLTTTGNPPTRGECTAYLLDQLFYRLWLTFFLAPRLAKDQRHVTRASCRRHSPLHPRRRLDANTRSRQAALFLLVPT